MAPDILSGMKEELEQLRDVLRVPAEEGSAWTMRILCTNDDGFLATGLTVLTRAARALGTVAVVAPDREQSATSNSLTIHYPLRRPQDIRRGFRRRWHTNGLRDPRRQRPARRPS